MPIGLETGTARSPEFTPNVNATYEIRIEAKTQGKLQPKVVNCLLGAELDAKDCAQPPVLRVGWVLTSREQVLEHGSTADKNCCANISSDGATARLIGHFHTEKGRPYVLLLNVLEDGTALRAADPHLIADSPTLSETCGAVLTVLLVPCGAAAIFGLFLMVSSLLAKGRQNAGAA